MISILIPALADSDADCASLDATSPCLQYDNQDKWVMRHNMDHNGTRFAHIVGFQLIHAPPL